MSDRKVLVLYAHPASERSEVNSVLVSKIGELPFVTLVDLYAEYPNYHIDIDKEQKRLKDHDVIVFQFPLYWYSTPAILKEWQDLVLEYGFAYGHDGIELKGKHFLCAITAGGKEDAYRSEGYNHFTIRELLQPLEQMANLTGMIYLPPFALFGARTALEEDRVGQHSEDYVNVLEALNDSSVDLNSYVDLPLMPKKSDVSGAFEL